MTPEEKHHSDTDCLVQATRMAIEQIHLWREHGQNTHAGQGDSFMFQYAMGAVAYVIGATFIGTATSEQQANAMNERWQTHHMGFAALDTPKDMSMTIGIALGLAYQSAQDYRRERERDANTPPKTRLSVTRNLRDAARIVIGMYAPEQPCAFVARLATMDDQTLAFMEGSDPLRHMQTAGRA